MYQHIWNDRSFIKKVPANIKTFKALIMDNDSNLAITVPVDVPVPDSAKP